jgi:Mn-containing catalase
LETIQPNFPPGILQSDPRHSNTYFNLSTGEDYTGPWNEGKSTQLGEEMVCIDDAYDHILRTNGLLDQQPMGTERTEKTVQNANRELSAERKKEIDEATRPQNGMISWGVYTADGENKAED